MTETEPEAETWLVAKSVTVSEVIGPDGASFLTITTEGDPPTWDILGLLDWAVTATRAEAHWPVDEDAE